MVYFFMINFRTDLALERRDIYRKANNVANEIDGIETQEENIGDNIRITRVKVLNEQGEQAIRKKAGQLYNNRYKRFKNSRRRKYTKGIRSCYKRAKEFDR